MPTFRYKARDARGELMTGLLNAVSATDAGALLRGEGKFVVAIDEAPERDPEKTDEAKAVRTGGRVRRDDVISFAHQLAAMIETGVPLSDALECAADQCDDPAFRAVLTDVYDRVQSGSELSVALRQHPKAFPPVMIALVSASELSGTMGTMLDRISGYLQKEQQTAKKIKSALTYPAIMLVMITGVTIGLLTWVLPKFTGIFASRGATLPLPTRILMAASESLLSYWYFWIGGVAFVVVSFLFAKRTEGGRRSLDLLKLRCPVLGELFRKLYITRSMRTMGTMLEAGVPILDMVATAREVTRNAWYEDLWDDLDDRMRRGGQLSDGMFETPLIPRNVAQMVYAGEKSGRLGKTMNKIATFTEDEFDEQVKATTSLIEPAMTAAMGLIIGFIAIALLLPIFSVSNVVAN